MTKRDRLPPLASQRDLDRKPALPTLGDWLGGIALFAGTAALYFIGWGVAG